MKLVYKIMIFMIIFPIVVLMINSLNVFPYTFYSDEEVPYSITQDSSPADLLAIMLVPSGVLEGMNAVGDDGATYVTVGIIVAIFAGIGSAVAVFTKSYAPIIIAFVGLNFYNLISKSFGLFRKIFMNWESTALMYLGLAVGIIIVAIVIITIMEIPAQGRSG